MDFNLFMWAAVNSETCLRRGWCQAVGGMSVYSSPSLNIQPEDKKPIVIVSSNMDSRSLFHDLTIGASKDVSSLVTVLAIADALTTVSFIILLLPSNIVNLIKTYVGSKTFRFFTKTHHLHIIYSGIMGICRLTKICKRYFYSI